MAKEDKQLLLRDLSARLPYGVVVNICNRENTVRDVKLTEYNIVNIFEMPDGWWKECKPYLRPMSSMTEGERKEYYKLPFTDFHYERIDWLLSHHFDFRGLIEKGLALEAPEGMYNT